MIDEDEQIEYMNDIKIFMKEQEKKIRQKERIATLNYNKSKRKEAKENKV